MVVVKNLLSAHPPQRQHDLNQEEDDVELFGRLADVQPETILCLMVPSILLACTFYFDLTPGLIVFRMS